MKKIRINRYLLSILIVLLISILAIIWLIGPISQSSPESRLVTHNETFVSTAISYTIPSGWIQKDIPDYGSFGQVLFPNRYSYYFFKILVRFLNLGPIDNVPPKIFRNTTSSMDIVVLSTGYNQFPTNTRAHVVDRINRLNDPLHGVHRNEDSQLVVSNKRTNFGTYTCVQYFEIKNDPSIQCYWINNSEGKDLRWIVIDMQSNPKDITRDIESMEELLDSLKTS